MAHLLPTPHRMASPGGAPFELSAQTGVVAAESLMPLAEWFRAEVASATGIEVASGAGSNAIRLELAVDDGELASLPETGGLRADDGDAQSERYALVVDSDEVTIRALAPEGIFRGLTSLFHLTITSPEASGARRIAPVTILDTARFAWRGLSFDVVRSFFAVEQVKQVIDLLALYKANVLHLHLTDSEGWRIQIDAWPKLAGIASQTAAGDRPGGCFTKDDYRELVRYAGERFITIVPEFDMPGHTAAIYRAYPELAGDGVNPESANREKAAWFQVMHPDHPRIFEFVGDVLSELAEMTPGAYIHIGGDEALGMDGELYRRFVERVRPMVMALGKKPIGWQETSRTTLQPGDVVQEWILPELPDISRLEDIELPEGMEMPDLSDEVAQAFMTMFGEAQGDLERALSQGANVLLSRTNHCYLDCKYSEPSLDPAQEADRRRLGMPFYPQVPVSEFFAWDPASIDERLTEDRIVGVEAGIWCETIVTFDDLLFMLLPRLPGVLEKGWSPAAEQDDATWAAYAPRLAAQAAEWDRRRWRYFRSPSVWAE